MSFELHQIAIHEIIKSAEESEAKVYLTEQLIPNDERAEVLTSRLHEIFSRKQEVLTAELSPPDEDLFAGYFTEMVTEAFSAEAFLHFSRQSTQSLQLNLQGVNGAKGGFLCFVHFSAYDQPFIAIYLLRNTEGLLFKASSEQAFELDSSIYLDLEKMAMACRINLRNNQTNPNVELIKHAKSQKDISEYFINWLGVKEHISNKDQTLTFLEAVSELPLPVDEESGEPLSEGIFREQVAKFVAKSPTNTINVAAFDDNFYGEEKPLQTHIDSHNVPLNDNFVYNKQVMHDYHFHRFKTKGLYLGCRHDFLLSGKVSLENGMILINDPDLFQEINNIVT